MQLFYFSCAKVNKIQQSYLMATSSLLYVYALIQCILYNLKNNNNLFFFLNYEKLYNI